MPQKYNTPVPLEVVESFSISLLPSLYEFFASQSHQEEPPLEKNPKQAKKPKPQSDPRDTTTY